MVVSKYFKYYKKFIMPTTELSSLAKYLFLN